MPEYLAPGVYIEETSFRAKTIEGVSTSTAGFIGPARYGPTTGVPTLITSFAEFERIYGGPEQLEFTDASGKTHNFLAHAVRAFFDNGGRRLYVVRVYEPGKDGNPNSGFASKTIDSLISPPDAITIKARYPGSGGNVRVAFIFRVGENVLSGEDPDFRLSGVNQYDVVWRPDIESPIGSPPSTGTLYWANRDRENPLNWKLHPEIGDEWVLLGLGQTTEHDKVHKVTMDVEVSWLDDTGRVTRQELWDNLSFHPLHRRSLKRVLGEKLSTRNQELNTPIEFDAGNLEGPAIARVLLAKLPVDTDVPRARDQRFEVILEGGKDGNRPGPKQYEGKADDKDPKKKTGLKALEDIQDVSIVAAPGYSFTGNDGFERNARQIMNHLISHSQRMRYRIAVLDSANGHGINAVREYRAQVDSTHAALYYPWIRIMDPITEDEINLPPSGFVAGIYARNDIEKGVHKAPANEIVRGAIGFEVMLNKAQQDVLNPEGINCFRFFEGRGYRLWGARTISSDPEWKYVNLRRYFAYLERSIERGTQWVVFENNSEPLWANVRRTVEDFLFNEWKSGHLMGEKPEQAYFVRCDRSTMTQNDLDNGRLVCLVGVAPVRPAEFVVFRIGQWTANRRG